MRGGFYHQMRAGKQEEVSLQEINPRVWRLAWRYIKPQKKLLFWAGLSMLGVTLAALILPYLTKVAVDDYLMVGDFRGLSIIAVLMLLGYGWTWLFSYWQVRLAQTAGQQVVFALRDDLYNHLQSLSLDFYEQRKVGSISSRVTNDVNAIAQLVSEGLVNFLNDILTVLGIVVIMFWLQPSLAAVLCLTIPLVVIFLRFMGGRMRKAFGEAREQLARMTAGVQENIAGMRVIQAMGKEEGSINQFSRLNLANFQANMKAVLVFGFFFPAVSVVGTLGMALVLGYGGRLVMAGELSIGILLAFLQYMRRLFMPLRDLSQVYNYYQSAGASLERIWEYLQEKPRVKPPVQPASLAEGGPLAVRLEGVSFGYKRGEQVLADVNIEIEPGEVAALVGPTGAGKSTLAGLMTRLYDTTEGKVLLRGQGEDWVDIREVDVRKLHRRVTLIPQDVFLFPRSLAENVAYGAAAGGILDKEELQRKVEEAARTARLHDLAVQLPRGYNTPLGEEGVRLSGGQRQLVALARALLLDPGLIILDEATASVDAFTEKQIQKSLKEVLQGRTALIIAHRFATLHLARRIFVLAAGRIVAVGTHNELLASSDLYQRLWQEQRLKA